MKAGRTFLLYDQDDPGSKPHLHIVITDSAPGGSVVLVSVTTERARSDTMTRLAIGDHPFIDRPSVITYAYAKLLSCAHLEALVACGEATPNQDASKPRVQRAQSGLRETDRAPQEVKDFFLDWLAQQGAE